jgi:hypothetical protein
VASQVQTVEINNNRLTWIYRESYVTFALLVLGNILLWGAVVIWICGIAVFEPRDLASGWLIALGILLILVAVHCFIVTCARIQVRRGVIDTETGSCIVRVGRWRTDRIPFAEIRRFVVLRQVGFVSTEWLVFVDVKRRLLWVFLSGFREGRGITSMEESLATFKFVHAVTELTGCTCQYIGDVELIKNWRAFPR